MRTRKKALQVKDLFNLLIDYAGKDFVSVLKFPFVITSDERDFIYRHFMVLHGDKPLSPTLTIPYYYADPDRTSILKAYENLQIAKSLEVLYSKKWERLYDVYKIEYDPIHNYLDEWNDENDGSSIRNESVNSTRTDNINSEVTSNRERTDNLSETNNGSSSNTDVSSGTEGKWGFNVTGTSSKPTDSSNDTTTSNGSTSNTKLNTGTQNVEDDSLTVAENVRTTVGTTQNNDTDSRSRSGKHFGNIGNLTSQKMINEEIETWKWSFFGDIVKDIADYLTLPIYFDC